MTVVNCWGLTLSEAVLSHSHYSPMLTVEEQLNMSINFMNAVTNIMCS